ncbi:aminopeptidase N [Arthrobacter sp. H14-L1]|uniref:aminopeptidase N n=1 Tax=Arthrobacter sp. H14-L1 TaxID=2996697 RepID=UPI00226F4B57|nr:aminopeptidase N [Arthrobacter sp. H14-L1]MCY0906481.1 aminopeptidase N [Arthrobacter sp. H14-L1]
MSNQNLRRDEAAVRSSLISIRDYDVSVDLTQAEDPAVPVFGTRSVIRFTAARPGAETFLDFIGADVLTVNLNGTELDPAAVVDDARIMLPNLLGDNEVTVTGTALYSRSGEGMHRFVDPADGQTYLYTQYEPADARRVFANFEQPDLKAPFTFHITAPSGWEVASNGVQRSCTPVELTAAEHATAAASAGSDAPSAHPEASRWDFAPTLPISTYITTILAGPYFKAQDSWRHGRYDLEVPLAAYCRASIAGSFDFAEIFDITKAGLTYFNELFDYAYPFGKYDQAFVPEYNLGAMENPGLVTFTDSYVFTSRATDTQHQLRANTIMHEMAHMWFGDLVTMFWWDDLWLKESFADFMGTLAVSEVTGWRDQSWVLFANRRKAWAYVQDQLPSTHPIVADIRDLEAAKQNFDGITYAKGASVLKQLVAYVGFAAFTTGSRQYFRDHEFGNTQLTDLLGALSAASGRDLRDWSAQWLETSGISTLSARVQSDDGVLSAVTIVQEAADPVTGEERPRPHLLKLGLYDFDQEGRLVRTLSVPLDVAGQETVVTSLIGQPQPALLLLNDEDLSYAKVRLDPVSQATVLGHLNKVTDPMTRTLCWSALWNAARDAVLPAVDYIRAVRRFAADEADVGLLASLLENARFATQRYCPAPERDDVRRELLTAVVDGLHAAEPGSDRQLVWARSLAALGADTQEAVPLITALLNGEAGTGGSAVKGLTADSELRWSLWLALAATGYATEAELDAELARDDSSSARAGHQRAAAARPVAAVKANVWRSAVPETKLSNALLSAAVEGFVQAPPELLAPYLEPYFGMIAEVWADRSIELSSRIVRGLYPAVQDLKGNPLEHPVVVRTDRWLAANEHAPAALRRIIVEQRDHLLRALAAQEAGSNRRTP